LASGSLMSRRDEKSHAAMRDVFPDRARGLCLKCELLLDPPENPPYRHTNDFAKRHFPRRLLQGVMNGDSCMK
jgi:hypothetical protein